MSLSLRTTLICDDVRREDNGKFLLIGVYTPNIVVYQLPATLQLCAFQVWESDARAAHQFRVTVRHAESGAVVLERSASMEVPEAGPGFLVLRFGDLRFEVVGTYELVVTLDEADRPAGTHVFTVRLK